MPINPINYPQINTDFSLSEDICKRDRSLQQPSNSWLFFSIIEERYPPDQWLRIYMDGSQDNKGSTGAGIHSSLFSYFFPVGRNKTNFDAEIEAISYALLTVLNRTHNYHTIVILTDSEAVIQAISSHSSTTNKTLKDILQTIRVLQKLNKYIMLQWIPSHIGIPGNEGADELAKKGTTFHQISKIPNNTTANTEEQQRRIMRRKYEQLIKKSADNKI